MGIEEDVQDAIQDTFCHYMEKKLNFRDEEHDQEGRRFSLTGNYDNIVIHRIPCLLIINIKEIDKWSIVTCGVIF